MSKVSKFKVGKYYIVKLTDQRNCEVIREYSKFEHFIYSIPDYSKTILKVLAFIVSIAIPPLLLITIPMIRRSNG